MGADDSAQTPEKPSKSSATTSAAATPTKHSSSSSGHPEASNSSAARKKPDSHLLLRHQGQKWQNVFDFEKILRQLRVAERQLKHKKCEYFGTNNVCQGCNADPGPNALQADSPPRAVKQVQRLDSRDMHYYGIVGNRSMLDIIVCNVCGGSYTKMGFNNHMMLHHPSVWSTISTKVELPQGGCESSVRLLPSGTDAATASEAAAPSSASESTTSRHKSKKASSKSGGGSSSSTSRSRSKSKHHSSSSHSSKHSSSVVVETKPPAAELPSSSSTSSSSSKKSGKNSKKGTSSSSSSAAAAAAAANAAASSSKDSKAGGYPVMEPSLSSLSSTSSSSSTTTTPKKSATPTLDSLVGASLANDAKDKVLTEKMSPIPSKKKSKSSSHSAPQESLDLAAPSSAPVFERPVSTAPAKSQKSSSNSSASKSSSAAASSSSYSSAKSSSSKKSKSEQKRSSSSAAAAAVADVAHQLSELDRAVSSITGGQEVKREPASTQADDVKPTSAKSGKSVAVGAYRKPPLLAELKKEIKTEPSASKYDGVNAAAASGMTQDTGSPLNNTILTFDDMLDNKFINEILGNSETELSYDSNCGNDSNGGMQQPAYSQHKPPASKRMRFDVQDSSQSMELQNDFAIYQPQQQQQTQQQQQFANYNGPAGVLEDIKLYNSPQSSNQPMEYQPQMHVPTQILQHQDQMDTVEANQLQQILYQQQQQQGMFHENGAKVELLQAPQFQQSQYCPEAGDVKPKSMELCAASEQDVKLEQYATLTAINTAYGDGGVGVAQPMVESEFQLYNVPSITDESSAMAMPAAGQQQDIIVNNMRLRCDPQYVLPPGNNGDGDEGQQHLIYEITGNNQVSVLRQHQVIAELLNQAGYENVEYMNVATPTGTTATTPAAAAAAGASGADESSEWFDFDFSHIETARTVLGSSSGSSSSSQIKPAKSEFSNLTPLKFHDDFYANVHVYARIPRPLALNTFGLVKLPWSVASTFRKQIVSARKANHSPVSLNMAGGGPNALAARGAKAAHNYFTALSAAAPGSSPVANNEFSIGSITITNSQNPAQAGGPGVAAAGLRPPGQQNGHIEISLNAATAANNPAAAAHSKLRQRMAGMMASPSGPIGSSLNPGSVTTSIGAVHCGSPSSNVRTVYVQNSPNALRIREPVVKRCVIASQAAAAAPTTAATGVVAGQDSSKPPRKLTAKQISEFLTSGRRIFEQQAPPTPTPPMPPPAVESCPKKMVRMNNFY